MKRLTQATFVLACTFLLSGCATIQGRWESVSVEPESAVNNFELGNATFNADGTYEATMKYGGGEKKSKGTYKHSWNTLTLTTEDGKQRKYETHLCGWCNELVLEYEPDGGEEIEVTMKRVGCAKGCLKACCKPKGCAAGCTKPCCKKA